MKMWCKPQDLRGGCHNKLLVKAVLKGSTEEDECLNWIIKPCSSMSLAKVITQKMNSVAA